MSIKEKTGLDALFGDEEVGDLSDLDTPELVEAAGFVRAEWRHLRKSGRYDSPTYDALGELADVLEAEIDRRTEDPDG